MIRLTLLGAVLLLPGCCFIGCDEETLVVPSAEVRVTTPDGEPLTDATVMVARHVEHPHFQTADRTKSVAVDSSGTATFTHDTDMVTQYPLMMHGVVGHTWQVCAEAPGHQTRALKWFSEGSDVGDMAWNVVMAGGTPLELELPLPPGESDPCARALDDEWPSVLPSDEEWGDFCETDTDCVFMTLYRDCCPICHPVVGRRSEREKRQQECARKEPTGCYECESEVDQSRTPRCVAGSCRMERPSETGGASSPK